MPLDGSKYQLDAPARELTLVEAAASVGLKPVSKALLEDHKARQLHRYRGSTFHRYEFFWDSPLPLVAAFALPLFSGLVAGLIKGEGAFVLLGLIGGLGALMVMIVFMMTFVVGHAHKLPAEWRAVSVGRTPIPAPIREAMEQLRSVYPKVHFQQFDLIQGTRTLDPYILAHSMDYGSSICLGIWDGNKIIACA